MQQQGSTPTAHGYTGEWFDDDLGLYYLRARWYHPDDGRFQTLDPYAGHISEPLTLNKYAYAHANPVNAVDPSGMAAIADYGASQKPGTASRQSAQQTGFATRCVYAMCESALWVAFEMALLGGSFSLVDLAMDCAFEALPGDGEVPRNKCTPNGPSAESLDDAAEILLATWSEKVNRPFGHNALGIKRVSDNKPYFFHQTVRDASALTPWGLLRGGQDTVVKRFTHLPPGYNILKLPVDNQVAQNIWLKGESMLRAKSTGPYSIWSNSCTTTCWTLLKSGGLQPPCWARTPSLLHLWFQSIGGR